MIKLTDRQLAELRTLAQPLPVQLRGHFLELVAQRLAGQVLGDGVVHKIAVEVQRETLTGAPAAPR